ncbi:hypothetical protein FPOA_09331 [Fusarium poae]|uniref:Uncharacterized protein n=1 Tax=Fusarium poae TaxID=36050 RepID=A0A1B8AR42_FUSPO|nr:hypothetical protein FPOA_09331 [Fusarium poae]
MDDLNCNGLNTTECLLRVTASILEQLKEDSSEFNWDPASFLVTLIIGIIAAAFAFFAIIQGFLAAGPGRHKCSKYAIGTWARLSNRKFDWSELRYRSIAHTPIIRIEELVFKMKIRTNDETSLSVWEEGNTWVWNQDRLFPKLKHVIKEPTDYFPATWLRLLAHTGLHHPELWGTSPQGTDYLPSDLAAAPAYSTVADLISIASITAGEIRFNQIGTGTAHDPSMRGEFIDVNFRSHPLLGVYAAIHQAVAYRNGTLKNYDMTMYCRPIAEILLIKLAYNRGFMPTVQPLRFDVQLHYLEPGLISHPTVNNDRYSQILIGNVYSSRCDCWPREIIQDPNKSLEGVPLLDNDRPLLSEWCRAKCSYLPGDWVPDTLRLAEGDISILAAAAPRTIINLFPKTLLKMGDKFVFMVILSRYCFTAGEVALRDPIVGEGIPAKNTTSGEERQNLPAFQVNKYLWNYSCAYTTSLGRPHEVRETHNDLDSSTLYMTREVQKELWEIDSWIKENELEYLMVCRIMAIAFTTLVCKEMYQGKQRMRRWPIECDITRQ